MNWPPDWLPDRLANWRPTRWQAIVVAAGGVTLAVVTLVAVSLGSSGGDDGEIVAGTNTAEPTATLNRSRSPSQSPSVTATLTPTPLAQPQPQTPVPTFVPPVPPPPARPSAHLTPLFTWAGDDPRVIELVMIPGSSDEAFVATQQAATIWKVSISGTHAPILVGDLSGYVGGGGNEEGLLSMAFSPNFPTDGRLYVYYTKGSPQPTVLARFQVADGIIDSGSQVVILEVPDFASNHNGGKIVFGRDGALFLSTGDGGGGGDPNENGQNVNTLLGKILRLNVTGQQTYSVPSDNPFVGTDGLDELWAYGFRNPWRISMDSANGDMWVGDVGQNAWEEVGKAARGGNHGWDCYEGFAVFESNGCSAGGFVSPRAAYPHVGGRCSVTGGYVYRGSGIQSLIGWYVYADYCSGEIWAVNASGGGDAVLLQDTSYGISSFAELPGGEIAVLTFDGGVHKLIP